MLCSLMTTPAIYDDEKGGGHEKRARARGGGGGRGQAFRSINTINRLILRCFCFLPITHVGFAPERCISVADVARDHGACTISNGGGKHP